MSGSISASRVATLVGEFDRSPAYLGLAEALRLLIGDGRVGLDVRLPSERELTEALDVSRTTVTRAYATLREAGYAEARRGSGTFTRVPGDRARAHDRSLLPRSSDPDTIDLNCAAPTAPAGLAAAYAEATDELPVYLRGHGYFPLGLPALQEAIAARYDAQGLPTSPQQVMVTPGALAGAAILAQALTGAGDRVLVESPTYPNATAAVRSSGARLVASPVDHERGWDLDAVAALLRQSAPRMAYLVPDFHNPTGHLMAPETREEYAALLRRTHTVPVIDEAHRDLMLDELELPAPFAAHTGEAITVGSASKSFWGGLRLGWVRAPIALMDRMLKARIALDLGTPVLEQLVLTRLLGQEAEVLAEHRLRLREQRDALAATVRELLPTWRFREPAGGLALWCRLPGRGATALAAEAERRGVVLAPGPVFAVEGGLDGFIRIPFTRPAPELVEAVRRLAGAWERVQNDAPDSVAGAGARRVLVA